MFFHQMESKIQMWWLPMRVRRIDGNFCLKSYTRLGKFTLVYWHREPFCSILNCACIVPMILDIYAYSRDKSLMIDVQAREITERDLQAGIDTVRKQVYHINFFTKYYNDVPLLLQLYGIGILCVLCQLVCLVKFCIR